jgi:glycosyltransferase involved in cell wall biosynthesis
MSRRVSMVVTTTATASGEVLATRLRALLDAQWDARLLCKGERWARDPALHDPALAPRVEFAPVRDRYLPPRSLLRHPHQLVRYLAGRGEAGPFDQRLLELRPELVHFHSGAAGWKGMRLKRVLGCRVVISFREDGHDLAVPDPEMLWRADLLLFPVEAALEHAVEQGCPREKAEILPEPLWTVGAPEMDGRIRKPGPLRVLSAGQLNWEQGFEHSVHAVRLLLDMGIGCEYRIVGEGNHLFAVAFARHQLGLADQVRFVAPSGTIGLVDQLRTADVFIDPAVSPTTSPTPLLTAQAMGIPFVATRRPGLAEDAGIAVPRRSPRSIADALAALAADPALRARMGEAGRVSAGAHRTVEEHPQRLKQLYRRVLA